MREEPGPRLARFISKGRPSEGVKERRFATAAHRKSAVTNRRSLGFRRRPLPRIPAIVAAQHILDRVGLRFGIAELSRPIGPPVRSGAGACVLMFDVARCLVMIGARAVAPALGSQVVAQLTSDECGGGAFLPGPAEIGFAAPTRQLALNEDETKRRFRFGAGGSDVAALLAPNMTVLEDRGRVAADKIDAAFDIAILEIRSLAVEVERVLPAEEPAVAEDLFVALGPHGRGLSHIPGGVLKRDVFGREVVRVN